MLHWLGRTLGGRRTAYLSHPDCLRHDMGAHHPESAKRLLAIERELQRTGLWPRLYQVEAPLITREQLARIHPPRYVERLEHIAPAHGTAHVDADTAMCPHSLAAASRAAGAVVRATQLVLDGNAGNAFCAVRPPGHHAEPNRGMGFCLYNNVALGVAEALRRGVPKVLIADFDVHHGNGTEEAFFDDPRVLMVSTFQHPCYPYSGTDPAGPNMLNVPLPPDSDGRALREAVESVWLPAIDAFKPEMVFVSAGFDAHRDDPLASLDWDEDDYAWLSQTLCGLSEQYAGGRLVSTLEGGYDLSALGRSAAAHLHALCTSAERGD